MAFGSKLRNRIVGVLVIVSIILILLPVMMQDRPVPNEPINEKPIAVNEDGAITDANGLLASQSPDYADLLEPYDDLNKNEEVLNAQPLPAAPTGKVEVLDLPDDGPFAGSNTGKQAVADGNNAPKEEILVAKKPALESKPAENKVTKPAANKSESAAKPADKGAYTVQVGVFSQDSNAQNVVKKLNAAGISSRIEKVKVNGRTLNRVYAGSANSRSSLQKLLPQIEKLTGAKGKIVSVK